MNRIVDHADVNYLVENTLPLMIFFKYYQFLLGNRHWQRRENVFEVWSFLTGAFPSHRFSITDFLCVFWFLQDSNFTPERGRDGAISLLRGPLSRKASCPWSQAFPLWLPTFWSSFCPRREGEREGRSLIFKVVIVTQSMSAVGSEAGWRQTEPRCRRVSDMLAAAAPRHNAAGRY